MKKLFLTFILACSLTNLIAQPKAQAAVAVGGLVFLASQMDCGGWDAEMVAIEVGSLAAIAGGVKLITMGHGGWGTTLIVLDEKNQYDQNSLVNHFNNKYPFINDLKIHEMLARLVSQELLKLPKVKEVVMVKVPASDVQDILEATDLNFEEKQIVLDDLTK